MILSFNVDYRTNWGEAIYLTADIPHLGNGDHAKAVKLELYGEQSWKAQIELPDDTPDFKYAYFVKHENGYEKNEWGHGHLFRAGEGVKSYEIFDRWQDQPWDKPFYSVVFTDCVCRREGRALPPKVEAAGLLLSCDAPMVAPDEVLAVSGGCDALGNWDPAKAVVMSDAFFPTWSCALPLDKLPEDLEYKFLILKKNNSDVVCWEGCDNRRLTVAPATKGESMAVAGMRFVNPKTPWRGAGVAIPVFSLRSEEDFGVGEFYDIKMLVDWAAKTGQRFIQMLPINDTTMTHTWTDSYPYNANSTFALHPMYLRLKEMGTLADGERQAYYDNLAKELNALEEVDYERVNNAKNAYTRELFAEVGEKACKAPMFRKFVKDNASWLTPYAAFCVLRDRNGSADFSKWGEYAEYDESAVAEFVKANQSDINYVYWIQYHLDKQMRAVRDYAHAHGVAIKGDIPIGISRNSVDAWISPRLFNLDCQAGAPPDDFSILGQNWGFPTYNWEEMNRDGFAWWKARFRKMAEYFDVYRIDHVLGFFRIWQIPMNQLHGLLGVFNPALPFHPDELRNSYDFWLDVDLQTTPYIMDYFLNDFFGEYTDEARDRFLVDAGYGRYRLRPEFATQRQVADYFAGQPDDEKNSRLCNALQGLIDQVLFVEDPYEKGKYHPRISAQYTYIYRSLTDYERWCFDRLYNDFYYHRHNDFWYGKAMWKLPPIIDATDMLTCAEDLGMIPDCVPAVMSALEILTLDIQRMPKNPREEFGNPAHYPYYTVCTTSTHDMSGIRQWWESDRAATQRFYNNILHEGGEAPFFAEPWVCEKIVESHLNSPAMLCILPLQDWLSIDGTVRRENPYKEQINEPAKNPHYWRYRMHLTLEDLLGEELYNRRVENLVTTSGR
ncbi:MAG: 4-alpha-glucanotransferase [Muribaculaceae bacterium]|nr:4-alpha-glucanotransferase [Muribaculaceae bacterium]